MKFIPHNYQKYCVNRLISDKSIGLFLDMGLGKTAITLTAINDLKFNRFEVSKILVIAPKKVAECTWSKEAQKWEHLKFLRVIPVLGTLAKRIRALNSPADIYVINRENVQWLVDYYRNAWPFDMVVVDEFSSFKNHQSKRFKALNWVRQHINRFVGLTGTPAPNGMVDLWAQVYLLDGGQRLEKKITHFREKYCNPDKRGRDIIYSYKLKDTAELEIQNKISDICVSMKAEDYLELPGCLYTQVAVELDKKARDSYDKLEREMVLKVDENHIDAGTAAVLTNKLLQLCNGAVYGDGKQVVEIHDCKIEVFLETVEGLNGHPALVFYNFKHDLDRIKRALQKNFPQLVVEELKGDREAELWNNRQVDILLAHPASCAYGLNLQAGGNHIIWFSLNWSLELYQQANARLHRQGQTQKVIIHHLITQGGVDEDVMTALENKSEAQEKLMQALKARIHKIQNELEGKKC